MPRAPIVPITLILALATALLTPRASHAALTVYAGLWDTEDVGEDIGFGVRFGLPLAPRLQLELGAAYYDRFQRAVDIAGQAVDIEVDARVLPFDAGLRLDIGRRGGFYLRGGGSYLLLDSDAGGLDDEVGWYGSLGFQLGRRLFVEGLYREAEGTVDLRRGLFPDPEVSPEVDVDLTGLAILVGFRF